MGRHRSVSGVQQKGCWALANLAVEAVNKAAIARAGGIDAVVAGMRAHRSNEWVQEDGCSALRNLARSDDFKTAIARAGGIEAVVAGMRAHRSIAKVQEDGCSALRNLALNDEECFSSTSLFYDLRAFGLFAILKVNFLSTFEDFKSQLLSTFEYICKARPARWYLPLTRLVRHGR